jgi:hypothetical protein
MSGNLYFLFALSLFLLSYTALANQNMSENFQNAYNGDYHFINASSNLEDTESREMLIEIAISYRSNKVQKALEQVMQLLNTCPKMSKDEAFVFYILYAQVLKASNARFEGSSVDRCKEKNNDPFSTDALSRASEFNTNPKLKKSTITNSYTMPVNNVTTSNNQKLSVNYPSFFAIVNGIQIPAIMDTGSEKTLLSQSAVEILKIEPASSRILAKYIGGTIEAHKYKLDEVKIGSAVIKDVTAINDRTFKTPFIVLGQDILRVFTVIKINDKDISFVTESKIDLSKYQSTDLTLINGCLCIEVRDMFGSFFANLDTGFNGNVLVGPEYFTQRFADGQWKSIELKNSTEGKLNELPELTFIVNNTRFENVKFQEHRTPSLDILQKHSIHIGSGFFYARYSEYMFDLHNMKFYYLLR